MTDPDLATRGRAAFAAAAGFLAEVARTVPSATWTEVALGVWTGRSLLGHALRAVTLVEQYGAPDVGPLTIRSPAEYYAKALATIGDPSAVAERGRAAGAALGEDLVATAEAAVMKAISRLGTLGPDAQIQIPIGRMALDDYLVTRIVELTIHGLDVAAAGGVEIEPPPEALCITLSALTELVVARGQGVTVLRALAGRGTLPSGFGAL